MVYSLKGCYLLSTLHSIYNDSPFMSSLFVFISQSAKVYLPIILSSKEYACHVFCNFKCLRISCFSQIWTMWLTSQCFGNNHFSSKPVNRYCLSLVFSGARKISIQHSLIVIIITLLSSFALSISFLALCDFLFVLKFKKSKACILVSLSFLIFLGAWWLQTRAQAFLLPKTCCLCDCLIIASNLRRGAFPRLL